MLLAFLKHGSNGALVFGALGLVIWSVLGGPALPLLWVIVGAALYYPNEYLTHRFGFHAPPSSKPWLLRLQRRMHYDHHAAPNRLDLLFLPLWFLAPVLALDAALIGLMFGFYFVPPIMLGVFCAILHYEWTHYVAHIPYQPITSWGRHIKRYHLRHHYINETYWFGVSNPSFDYLWGTAPDPGKVAKSQLVRNLFGEVKGDLQR